MRDEAETSVVRRMTGLRAGAAGLTPMTPARALRNAVAKAGDEALATAVGVRDMVEDTLLPDDLVDGLPDPALILQLVGPDGATGLAIACPQVVGAAVEMQTMGHVLQGPAADRRPTRTDAMLVSGFLDKILAGFGVLAAACADPPMVGGFGSGKTLADARAARMGLCDASHRRYALTLDFASGAKTGSLVLIFPVDRAVGPAARKGAENWHATLEHAVLGTSARIEAVLCKLTLPLSGIGTLAVGDVLTLTGAALDGVSLVGSDGGKVVKARLGRSGGMRAVRLFLDGTPPRKSVPMSDGIPLPAVELPLGQAPPPKARNPDEPGSLPMALSTQGN